MDFDERILEMRKQGEALRQAFGYERNLAVPIFEDAPWYDEQEIAALSRKPCRMSTGIAETMFHAEAYGIY